MEQVIVEFLSKASELILHNRLITGKSLDAALNQMTNPNPWKFQLAFDQKFNFSEKIPAQWNSHNNKLLVLEFFLKSKANQEKFLVEQWIFELNQVSDKKLKHTIDSPNTLYKRLAVLLRTISVLTVSLPLYKSFLNDKTNSLSEGYVLEQSINFTRHTLSNWHASVHEEKNLANHTNPDLVLPGRTFAFQVNSLKSLKFLQNVFDESIIQEPKPDLKLLKEKLDLDYFGPNKRDRGAASDGVTVTAVKSIRKSTSDTNKGNLSFERNSSPRDPSSFPAGGDNYSDNASPIGSILASSPIETQRSPGLISEVATKSRKNSGGYPWESKTVGNRPRFATIDSEGSGEYDMYIVDDVKADFTEVLSVKEINVRIESPVRFMVHPKLSADDKSIMEASRGETNGLKLSANLKPIEKIIEQTDDDKIAELLQIVEDLKDFYNKSYNSRPALEASSLRKIGSKEEDNLSKGLRFEVEVQEVEDEGASQSVLSGDYHDLGELFTKLKAN